MITDTKPSEPFPTGSSQKRSAFRDHLLSELPAFVHFIENWEVPKSLECERFGVIAFHHPELLVRLDTLSPEVQLLELIDMHLWRSGRTFWEGTAKELQRELTGDGSTVQFEARKLLGWPNACGTYLARLLDKSDARVSRHRTAQTREWRITAPQKDA